MGFSKILPVLSDSCLVIGSPDGGTRSDGGQGHYLFFYQLLIFIICSLSC